MSAFVTLWRNVQPVKTVFARPLWIICCSFLVLLGALSISDTSEAQTNVFDGPVDRIWLIHRTAAEPGFAEGNWRITLEISTPPGDTGMGGAKILCHARNLRKNFNERQPGQGDVYEISISEDCTINPSDSPLTLAMRHIVDRNITLRNERRHLWLPDAIFVVATGRVGENELRVAKTEWNCWFGPPNKRKDERTRPAQGEWRLDDPMCD